jgi:hypothetical protein
MDIDVRPISFLTPVVNIGDSAVNGTIEEIRRLRKHFGGKGECGTSRERKLKNTSSQ